MISSMKTLPMRQRNSLKNFDNLRKEGLHQYYEIEQTTDLWSLNSGRVQAKMGVNEAKMPDKTPVSFVVIGGKYTSTLIDGQSLRSESELSGLGALKLIECKALEDSYLRLRYEVIH